MIRNFTYEQRTRIEFGQGCLSKIADIVRELHVGRVLIVTDKNIRRLPFFSEIEGLIRSAGAAVDIFDDVEPNPSVNTVNRCGELAKDGCGAVVAVGGGSVIDTAKGASMLCSNEGSVAEYLLGAGEAMKTVSNDGIPVIAVPTTAGTGSEVSSCIVVTDSRDIKDLVLSNYLFPQFAVIDPDVTLKLPPYLTAGTGLDVLGHALEGFTSVLDCEMSELMALEAIRLTFEYLPKCVHAPDIESRGYMAYACMLAGIAQSLGACTAAHALSCPLTIRYGVPHGHAVGICQIPVIKFTKDAIPEKYKRIADYIAPKAEIPAEKAADYLIGRISELLADVGIAETVDSELPDESMLNTLADEALADDGVNVTAREVSKEDIKLMYREIFRK